MKSLLMTATALLASEGVGTNLNHHGAIALANDTFFTSANYNQFLTDFAIQFRDPEDVLGELDFLFPPRETTPRFTYDSWEENQAFLLDPDNSDLRAINADFAQVQQLRTTEVTARTYNKGLSIRIDKDRIGTKGTQWQTEAVGHLRTRLARLDHKRGITLLDAAAVSTSYIWDTAAGVDPDIDIDAEARAASLITGVRPNSIFIAEDAWSYRERAYRSQNTAGGYASAALTLESMLTQRMLARGRIGKAKYANTSTAKAAFLSGAAYLFHALDNPAYDPVNLVNFWSPCFNGQRFATYITERDKYYVVTVEHYSKPTVTSSRGIRKLAITNS